MKIKKILLFACLGFAGTLTARSAVILKLVDADNLGSSTIVKNGSSFSFSLSAYVTGITTPSLNNFDLSIDSLPSHFTLTSFSETVPTGWITLPNKLGQQYGAANFTGEDLAGSAVLVTFNFAATGATPNTAYMINFIPQPSKFQELRDSSPELISFTQQGASVSVIPEPSHLALVAFGLIVAWLATPHRPFGCRQKGLSGSEFEGIDSSAHRLRNVASSQARQVAYHCTTELA